MANTIYYDRLTNNLISGTDVTQVTITTTYPKAYRLNDHAIIRCYIYSDASTSTVANLTGYTFTAKIGVVGSTALIDIPAGQFNVGADWSLIDATTGKICFNFDTNNAAIDTALGSLDSKTLVCNINGAISGVDDTIAQFYINIINVPE